MARFELVPGEKRGVVCCALWRRLYEVNGRRTDEAREEHVRASSASKKSSSRSFAFLRLQPRPVSYRYVLPRTRCTMAQTTLTQMTHAAAPRSNLSLPSTPHLLESV